MNKPRSIVEVKAGQVTSSAPRLQATNGSNKRVNSLGSEGAFFVGGPLLAGVQLKSTTVTAGAITPDQLVGGYINFAHNIGLSANIDLPTPKAIVEYLSRENLPIAGNALAQVGATTPLTEPSVTVQGFTCTFATSTGLPPILNLNGLEYYPNGPAGAPGALTLAAQSLTTVQFIPIDLSNANAPRFAFYPTGNSGSGVGSWETALQNGASSGGQTPIIGNPQNLLFQGAIKIGGQGVTATTTDTASIAIGANAYASGGSVALGNGATTTGPDQIRLGTATTTVSVPGTLQMDPLPTQDSDHLLVVPTFAGNPTAPAPDEGSMMVDTASNTLYYYSGGAWRTPVGVTSGWGATLAADPLSGDNTPTVTDNQQIQYTGPVRIGGGGFAATSTWADAVAIGPESEAIDARVVALGWRSKANVANSVAIGDRAIANAISTTAAGSQASAQGDSSSVYGRGAYTYPVAVGGVAIGYSAGAQAARGVAIGNFATSEHAESVALGFDTTTTAANQLRLGRNLDTVSVPGALDVELDAAFHQALTMDPMTSDTDIVNRLTIPTFAGAPGLSAPPEGTIMIDTASNKLYFYSSGAWNTSVASGSNWSDVLAAGPSSGDNQPTITNDQQIMFLTGVRIGNNNTSTAAPSITGVAIGGNANSSGVGGVAIGSNTTATGDGGTAVGGGADATAQSATAIGLASEANTTSSTALGHTAKANGDLSMALGWQAETFAGHFRSTAVGAVAKTTAANQVRLGTATETVSIPGALDVQLNAAFHQALTMDPMTSDTDIVNRLTIPTFAGAPGLSAPPEGTIMIDTASNKLYFYSSGVWNTTVASGTDWASSLSVSPLSGDNTPTIDNNQQIKYTAGIRIAGNNTNTSAFVDQTSISIGSTASALGTNSISMGLGADAQGANSIAIGRLASALFEDSVAIGPNASATAPNQIRLGDQNATVFVYGKFEMEPLSSADSLRLPRIPIFAGAPVDNGQPDGTMMIDTTSNALYIRSGGVWHTSLATGNNWADVLLASPNSGPHNPRIETGQNIVFQQAVRIGKDDQLPGLSGAFSLAIGDSATRSLGDYSNAIGTSCQADGERALALGYLTRATANNTIAIGCGPNLTRADAVGAVAIGSQAQVAVVATDGIAIGFNADVDSIEGIAIGSEAYVDSTADRGIALGKSARAQGLDSTAIGNGAEAVFDRSTALGFGAQTDRKNQVKIGGPGELTSTGYYLETPFTAGGALNTPDDSPWLTNTTKVVTWDTIEYSFAKFLDTPLVDSVGILLPNQGTFLITAYVEIFRQDPFLTENYTAELVYTDGTNPARILAKDFQRWPLTTARFYFTHNLTTSINISAVGTHRIRLFLTRQEEPLAVGLPAKLLNGRMTVVRIA